MESLKNFFKLFALNFYVKIKNSVEFAKVVFLYYRKFEFAKTDFSLLLLYLLQNPFKISKRFLMKKGESDIYAYGETPLTSIALIAKFANLKPSDRVFELGCGRGRSCFWLRMFIRCDVVGIEFVPEFVEKANQIKNYFSVDKLEFRLEDMLESNFEGATIFYLYGTCYEDEFIRKLVQKLKILPKGTKIITVSYALNDYSDKDLFEVTKKFPAEFTWGKANVYCQELI